MKWLDIEDIAIGLQETYGDVDIFALRFTDLKSKVMALDGFNDDAARCNEKILEAIQMAWLEERN